MVSYVVVASRPNGPTNAFFEGVRCASEEVKTYARYNGGEWHPVSQPEWKRFSDINSSWASELASQGLCRGHAPRASVKDMVHNMRQPIREVQ